MQRKDHPTTEAVSSCSVCGAAMHAGFVASNTENPMCSRCAAMSAVSDFSDQENEQFRENELNESKKEERSIKRVRAQLLIVVVALFMVSFQLYSVFNSNRGLTDDEIADEIAAEDNENECVLLLWEIGERLQDNQMPPDSTRCEGMSTSFLVSRANGDIVVSHPNPSSLGYRTISVSKSDSEPLLIEY